MPPVEKHDSAFQKFIFWIVQAVMLGLLTWTLSSVLELREKTIEFETVNRVLVLPKLQELDAKINRLRP